MPAPVRSAKSLTRRLWLQKTGADMVEYALLAGFLAVTAAATLYVAGDRIQEILRKLRSRARRG